MGEGAVPLSAPWAALAVPGSFGTWAFSGAPGQGRGRTSQAHSFPYLEALLLAQNPLVMYPGVKTASPAIH